MRLSVLVPLIAAIASPALADGALFAPRSIDSGVYLDLFASTEEDDTRLGERGVVWSDDFAREKVTLFTRGYVYHPRFLLYDLELGGTAKQEEYASTNLPDLGRRDGDGYEYKLKLHLLPEHSYNLELFALRWQPLFKEQSAAQRDRISTSHGVDFRYRAKPWFFRSRYTDNRTENDDDWSDVRRLGIDGEYFRRFESGNQVTFRAAVDPTAYSNSGGLDGESLDGSFSNSFRVGRLSLQSSVDRSEIDQRGTSESRFESTQLTWYERLTAELPGRFRVDASYRFQDSETVFTDERSGSERRLDNQDRELGASVVHRLYESLRSTYTFRRSERASDRRGTTDAEAHALSVNYSKKIPGGRLLASAGGGRAETESDGFTDVVEEPHPGIEVPATFPLAQRDVDPASLALFLRSPLPPFETIQLTEGVHYSVVPLGDTLEIGVFALPPQFVVPGTYDFAATYSLLGGRFRLRNDHRTYGASLELFDSRIAPYANYFRSDSEVLEGYFPGAGLDSTTTLAGLRLRFGAFRFRVEHQDVDWEVDPYRAWKADLQIVGHLGPTTSLYATAAYRRREFDEPRPVGNDALTLDETRSVSANLQKRFLERSLVLSLGGSYSVNEGILDTTAVTANTAVSWKIGKLDFSAGLTYSDSQTETSSVLVNERERHYAFLRLRRKIS